MSDKTYNKSWYVSLDTIIIFASCYIDYVNSPKIQKERYSYDYNCSYENSSVKYMYTMEFYEFLQVLSRFGSSLYNFIRFD